MGETSVDEKIQTEVRPSSGRYLETVTMRDFLLSLTNVVCEMAPYLLLGFFIAGVLHVFVPQNFYRRYLSADNKLAVLWAALLGVPLPLCSC